MVEEPDRLRAADVDREFVAERLREAHNEGRLDLHEFDERLRQAYSAKSYGELNALLSDLPQARGQVLPTSAAPPAVNPLVGGLTTRWVVAMWSSWLSLASILIVIWALSGDHGSFWPIWPLGIWGAILLARTLSGLASGEHHRREEPGTGPNGGTSAG